MVHLHLDRKVSPGYARMAQAIAEQSGRHGAWRPPEARWTTHQLLAVLGRPTTRAEA